MILSQPIKTQRLELRVLQPSDATADYLSWLRDPEVTRYLELRFTPVSDCAELAAFIDSVNASPDNLMFGIFLASNGRHIGNIKLGPIVRRHGRAEIGFLIGDRESWGKGYASEAIQAVARHGIDACGLAKITAGCYDTNIGSSKALLKAGFSHQATIPSHVICEGRRVASLLYGLDR